MSFSNDDACIEKHNRINVHSGMNEIKRTYSYVCVDVQMYSSFLLHPRYSQLLLERRNPVQNIIAFKGIPLIYNTILF